MSTLDQTWLDDQVLAFCAAMLVGSACPSQTESVVEQNQLANLTNVIVSKLRDQSASWLSDTTLSLLNTISAEYDTVHPDMPEHMQSLADVRRLIKSEIKLREKGSGGISSLLVNHAVYVLKQPQLDIYKFFVWFKRNVGSSLVGVGRLLEHLSPTNLQTPNRVRSDQLLSDIRDGSEQTHDRVQAIDDLYAHLHSIVGGGAKRSWLLRVFLALRNSMYCWPLMIGGPNGSETHGVSLPIGLFLSPDDKPKVYFKIVLPRRATTNPRPYVSPTAETPAHMSGSRLYWDQDWANAVWLGLEVAKELWGSQNGRLKFVNAEAAEKKFKSSLVLDLGEACKIVDTALGGTDVGSYTLRGRSAEAYWAQAVLGLLLPAREIPLGVVTGRIERAGGAYELRHVEGIEKKLEYANNAGFPRIVLPGLETEYSTSDETLAGTVKSDDVCLARDDNALPGDASSKASGVADLIRVNENAEGSIQTRARQEVRHFLKRIAASGSFKRIEINYCSTARNAADAMQPSGWRRATFLRLPEVQREFSNCLRRLFLREEKRLKRPLSREEIAFYRRNPWLERDDAEVTALDRWLISDTNSIKFFDLDRKGGVDGLGKWLAWKDHQIRTGAQDEYGVRGPGLGILCVRTAEGDNDMRLWSTIADIVAANPQWLSRFQWAGREQAAQLLATLLGNRSANSQISLTSAPDILVVLDEGNLTQRRINPIFPDDFRGSWLDLLNPTKGKPNAPWPLREALYNLGKGAIGHTRIVVVYGTTKAEDGKFPNGTSEEEKDLLSRMAVYRFGFSKQAAYAIINHDRLDAPRITWSAVEEILQVFRSKGIVRYSKGQYYIARDLLERLREGAYWNSPDAHLSAALALAPIIDPNRLAISSNRDRSLEPETVIEAHWHLQKARAMTPPRELDNRRRVNAAFNNLIFLRPFSDWDTFKGLQVTSCKDAVELGRELLGDERQVSCQHPHSSRVAALINSIGEFGSGLSEDIRSELATEATNRCENALSLMDTKSGSDKRRQRRKLFSDYLYCMKKLDVSNDDPRLTGAKAYLQQTVEEVVDGGFFERIGEDFDGLDEYPISSDWLRSQWEDTALDLRDRARAAYVSARLSIGRRKDGKDVRAPWDGPWLDYFALTSPALFDAAQLNSPLMTWNTVFGSDIRTESFAKQVLDSASFRPRKPPQAISPFGEKWRQATDNLWSFITSEDSQKRLRPTQSAIALKILRAIALSETLPAFDFLCRRELSWFFKLPTRIGPSSTAEWNALACQSVASHAGWVRLLSAIDPMSEDGLAIISSWLAGCLRMGVSGLYLNDPENLLSVAPKHLELATAYRLSRRSAIWNGYQLLGRKNERGWAIYHDFRSQLERIVDQLNGESHEWLMAFANSNQKPGRHSVAGVGLMLERRATATVMEAVRNTKGLDRHREKLIGVMPRWSALADNRWRGTFERFRAHLSVESV